jgi:hypothetical protein
VDMQTKFDLIIIVIPSTNMIYREKSERKVPSFVPVKKMTQHSVTLFYISTLFPLPGDKLFH